MTVLEQAVLNSGNYAFSMEYKPDFPLTLFGNINPFTDGGEILLGRIIHPDDYQPFCDVISDIIAKNSSELKVHLRLNTKGFYRWYYISAAPQFGENKNFKGLCGMINDVTEYLDCEGEDAVMTSFRKKIEGSLKAATNTPKLIDLLGLDYLERIQQPFSHIEGLYSVICDESGTVIASALDQDKKINLNKMSYQRKKNIRIKHQNAGTWIIASESMDNVNRAAPLLETMVHTVAEIANSYIMIYEEMENSRNANRMLGQNFEDQILVNNVYSMILQCKTTSAAFGSVIPLVKEYFSLDEILFLEDNVRPVKTYQCTDDGEVVPISTTVDFNEALDRELEYNSVVCIKEDDIIHNAGERSCALSRVYEKGNSRGVLMFTTNENNKCWTNRELKSLKNITQIISTIIYKVFMENELLTSQEHLTRLAYFTPETGIPNRSAFERDLLLALQNKKSGAVVSVEIANMKKLSEMYNAHYAEQTMRSIAEYISAIPTLGAKTVYQFSSDILFLLIDGATKQSTTALANTILAKFRSPWFLKDTENKMEVYCGITLFPEDICDISECVQAATRTLRLAKDRKLREPVNYSVDLEEKLNDNLRIRQLITESIENDFKNFYFLYTPIVDAVTGELACCEAHLFLGNGDIIVPSDRFLPIVERMGMLMELYNFVIERICEFSSGVRECGLLKFFTSISLPDRILAYDECVMIAKKAMLEFSISPDAISFAAHGEHGTIASRNLKQLAALGIKIIAEDEDESFFTDDLLNKPDITMVKIRADRLHDDDEVSKDFAKSFIERAHAKNLRVCVKGVDNAEDLRKASLFNADFVQGIINGRPLHTTEFVKKMVISRTARQLAP